MKKNGINYEERSPKRREIIIAFFVLLFIIFVAMMMISDDMSVPVERDAIKISFSKEIEIGDTAIIPSQKRVTVVGLILADEPALLSRPLICSVYRGNLVEAVAEPNEKDMVLVSYTHDESNSGGHCPSEHLFYLQKSTFVTMTDLYYKTSDRLDRELMDW